jgi:hypothetical protein
MAAGNATIGALRVTLGADTADLEKGLQSSQASLAAFAGAVAGGMAAITTRAIAFAEDVGKSLTKVVTDMGELHDTSQKLGVSVEALSVMAYQANLADVSFESLSKSSIKLSKAMVSAVSDPAGEAAKAFKDLGISAEFVRQNLNNQPAILGAIADAYSELQDGAGKTANATKLLGKAGADLIPMLNDGKESLDQMAEEAKKFGVVVSAAGAAAADTFGDNMKKLGQATKGIFVQALEQVLPSLALFTESLVEARKESAFASVAIEALGTALKAILTTLITANALFSVTITTLGALANTIAQVKLGEFAAAFDAAKKGISDIGTIATNTTATLANMWSGADKANADAEATKKNAEAKKELAVQTTVAKDAIDQFLSSQAKHLAGMNAEIMTLGMQAGAREAAKVQLQAYTVAAENNQTMTQAQIDKTNQLAEAMAAAKMTLEGWQTTQANLTPAEKLLKTQTDLKEQLDAGAISATTFGRAMQNAAQAAGATWEQAFSSMAGSFSQLFSQLAKKNKEWLVFAKAAGIAEATINTYTAFTKALTAAPPPLNYALAAATLAAGLAKVIAISSQTIPNAAVGFSGRVPGGFGGGDSKLFQAMVEPGEQINVTPNSAVGQSRVVEVYGMGSGRYSLDEVKEIMKGIGDAMGFGYKFVST